MAVRAPAAVSIAMALLLATSAFAGIACKDPYTYHLSHESCIAASCPSGWGHVTGYRVGGSSGLVQGGCSSTSRNSAFSCEVKSDSKWQTRYDLNPSTTYECNSGTLVSTDPCIDTSMWRTVRWGESTSNPCDYCIGE
jgi:hypothetical protein